MRLASARDYWLCTTMPSGDRTRPRVGSDDVVYAIRPRSAMTWRLADYENAQRRWTA